MSPSKTLYSVDNVVKVFMFLFLPLIAIEGREVGCDTLGILLLYRYCMAILSHTDRKKSKREVGCDTIGI